MVSETGNKTSLIRLELPRMIRSNLRAFIALVVVSSAGIALLIALNNASDRLYASVRAFREEYLDADIMLMVAPANLDVSDALLAIDGVERVQTRLVYDASVRREDGRIVTLRFFTYDEGDFPRVTVAGDAALPEGSIPVALAELFSARNDVRPGDSVTLLLGGKEYPLFVSGIATSPQAMKVLRDIYVWYDDIDFGYAYIGREDLRKLMGVSGFYNQVLLRTEDGADNDATLAQARAVMQASKISVLDASSYENSTMQKWVVSMISPIRVIASILPPVFFLVMLLFLYISLSQTIARNRKTIGILRAMGFTIIEILLLFSAYAFAITVLASAIGAVGGGMLAELVYRTYAENMMVPAITGGINPQAAIVGVLICLATGQAASLILTGQLAKINAASAMRPATSESRKTPFLLRTALRRMSSMAKLMLATILRKKQRLALSTLSLISAAFLILISLSLVFSQRSILDHTFSKRMRYDAQVRFDTDIDAAKQAQIRALSQVAQCDFALVFTQTVNAGGEEKVLMICGLPQDASLVAVFDENYREIAVPQEGIVLEKNFASDHDIRAGDGVKIGIEDVTVSAITAEDVNYIQYCPYDLAMRLSGREAPNMAFCRIAEGMTQEDFLNAMVQIEGCAGVTFADKQYASGKSNMDLVNLAMTIIIACAMVMGFVIVYNTSLYAYTDWEREYAILRAEGFGIGQVALISVAEVAFEYVVSLLFALPLGLLASSYTLAALRDQTISYPLANPFLMCVVTASIMLLFIGYGLLLSVIRLKRMRIATVIKPQ